MEVKSSCQGKSGDDQRQDMIPVRNATDGRTFLHSNGTLKRLMTDLSGYKYSLIRSSILCVLRQISIPIADSCVMADSNQHNQRAQTPCPPLVHSPIRIAATRRDRDYL